MSWSCLMPGSKYRVAARRDAGGPLERRGPRSRSLQVNRALSDGEFVTPKTPRSRRKIELSNTACGALRAYRKRQLEEQMKKAGLWKDHGLVFPSTVGTPLSHRNVVRSFKALLKRADLPAV